MYATGCTRRSGVVYCGEREVAPVEHGKVTIYDIAREAGVSAATVSRVLSGHPHVSEKTAKRVGELIEKYNFRPSSVARGLYHRTSHTLGIVMPGVENPYYATVFTAAYQEAHIAGFTTLVYATSQAEKLDEAFAAQLVERRLDGALILGGTLEAPDDQERAARTLRQLLTHMPLVTICPPIPDAECINFHSNLKASVRQSVHHLYGLGHKRIAFLGGSTGNRSATEREKGFLEIMESLGLAAAYNYETGHTPEAGEVGIAKLLSSLPREKWPTAVVTINDLAALGAMRQIKRMGLRIPNDIAVIGCDNQFFSQYLDPPLTTVDNHPSEMGRLAMSQLVAVVKNGAQSGPFSQMRESTLIVRESCGVQLGRRTFP